MKIKNSNNNLRLGIMLPVVCAATALLSVFRCFQTVKYIDPETGFLVGGQAVNAVLCFAIAIACVFFVVISFLSAESKKVNLVGLKDKGTAVACIIFAVSLIYDAGDSFFESISIFNGLSVSYFYKTTDAFKILMSSGSLPYALQSFFAILSAIYIVFLAKSFIKGSGSAHNHKLLALSPVAWAGCKLITRFVKQISYIKVSDLFLELMMLAFAITFFVALAQVVSGVYIDDSRWRITALGFSAGLLALCINIPRLVLTFVAQNHINAEYPFNLADSMFGLFAIFVAAAALKSVKESADVK